MVSLDKFIHDVKHGSKVTPIVMFSGGGANEDTLLFSTSNFVFSNFSVHGNLLSIPSIKESLDIENRKYKIGSINLTFNNDRAGSQRLSNMIYNDSRLSINSQVFIFYKTNSMESFTNLFLVYTGKIRDIKNTIDTISITAEDSSQEDFHKELPSVSYTHLTLPTIYSV